MATAVRPPATQPSPSLLGNLRAELMRHVPFGQMQPVHVDQFLAGAEQAYYAPGETVLSPADGAPRHLILIRQGHVTGRVGGDTQAAGFDYDAGDIFPEQRLQNAIAKRRARRYLGPARMAEVREDCGFPD